MAAFTLSTILAASAVALTAAGTATSIYGQRKASSAQRAAQAAEYEREQKLEAQRKQQMELEAARRRRELYRQFIAQRQTALSNTTNAGAGGGSALPGAYGTVAGRFGVDTLGVNQNLEIGRNTFDINQQYGGTLFGLNQQIGSAQSLAYTGSGLASLGGALLQNQGALTRIGTTFGGGNLNLNSTTFGRGIY